MEAKKKIWIDMEDFQTEPLPDDIYHETVFDEMSKKQEFVDFFTKMIDTPDYRATLDPKPNEASMMYCIAAAFKAGMATVKEAQERAQAQKKLDPYEYPGIVKK